MACLSGAGGRSLLLLLPREAAPMREALEAAGVPLKALRMNPEKTQAVGTRAAGALLQGPGPQGESSLGGLVPHWNYIRRA